MADRLVRFTALIVLCALVYYFSYDQGRRSVAPEKQKLEEALTAKEKVLEALALEVGRLKRKTAALELELSRRNPRPNSEQPDPASVQRMVLRLGTARVMLNQRLVVALLEINRPGKAALIQLNFIKENKIKKAVVRLGRNLAFELSGKKFMFVLDDIRATSVTIRFINSAL